MLEGGNLTVYSGKRVGLFIETKNGRRYLSQNPKPVQDKKEDKKKVKKTK